MLDDESRQSIIAAIQSAAQPAEAAQALIDGLCAGGHNAAVWLRPEGLFLSHETAAPERATLTAWLRAVDRGDALPTSADMQHDHLGGRWSLEPIRSGSQQYGLLALEQPPPATPTAGLGEDVVTLLAALVGSRIAHLRAAASETAARRDAALSGLYQIARMATTGGDAVDWGELHDHLNLLFDASSFFIALYQAEAGLLELPLVSSGGVRLERDPIPLCGVSRAIIAHGIELHFQDLEAEHERLAALGIVQDEREPGAWSASWLGAPLRGHQSEVIGAIALQNELPYAFDDEDLLLLLNIAAGLGAVLSKHRLIALERERRLYFAVLADAGQALVEAGDADEVIDRILDLLQRVIGFDTVAVMLSGPDAHDGTRMVLHTTHDPEQFLKGMPLRFMARSPVVQAFAARQPLVIEDVQKHSGWDVRSALPDALAIRSWMGLPLVVRDRTIGLIGLGRFTPDQYADARTPVAFALARVAAASLEGARLRAAAQSAQKALTQRARRLESIYRITSVITSSLQQADVIQMTAQLLQELFEVDRCAVVLVSDVSDLLVAAEYPPRGTAGLRVGLEGNDTFAQLNALRTALAIEAVEAAALDVPTWTMLNHMGAQSALFAPLVIRDRVLGAIALLAQDGGRQFAQEERETLMSIAGQVAMALYNADLYQEAIVSSRLKSEFLANVSHELRTPLNAIIGYTDMLLDSLYGDLNAQQRDRLERVSASSKHLLSLINDVLELSKIEAEQVTLATVPMHVSGVVEEVIASRAQAAQAKNLPIRLEVPHGEPEVYADPNYLPPIINQLLDNAIKFTAAGEIVVTLQVVTLWRGEVLSGLRPPARLAVPDGEWLAISIADTGIGIAPAHQDVIFESFHQVDGSTVREYGGAGLGLAIVRQLVRLHSGYVWVESVPGEGSTFTVLLPCSTKVPTTPSKGEAERQPVVLVLADNAALIAQVRAALPASSFRVVEANAPAQVFKLAQQRLPDMLVVSLHRSPVTGWETLRALQDEETTAHVPVVALYPYGDETHACMLGSVALLTLPVDQNGYLAALSRLLPVRPKEPLLLLLEDAAVRTQLELWANRAGYHTIVETLPREEPAVFEREPVALVILAVDPRAPFTSLALVARLRANPYTVDLPVIGIVEASSPVRTGPLAATEPPLNAELLRDQIRLAQLERQRRIRQ